MSYFQMTRRDRNRVQNEDDLRIAIIEIDAERIAIQNLKEPEEGPVEAVLDRANGERALVHELADRSGGKPMKPWAGRPQAARCAFMRLISPGFRSLRAILRS